MSAGEPEQISWMLGYLRGRYGPEHARAREQAPGWYDKGGALPPGISLARNDTDEPEDVEGAS